MDTPHDAHEAVRLLMLEAEVARLRAVCAEAHQFARALGAPQRVVDNLAAVAMGQPPPHASFLPVRADECEEVRQLQAALIVARTIR